LTELPAGTVTFLFTDIEGSTRLWDEHADAMKDALARHDAILREAVESRGGSIVKTTGDGLHAAFATAEDGIGAAVAAQSALGVESWGSTGPLRVRMSLHTGTAELRDGDYYGAAINRAARLMAIGHGGQVLLSTVTADLVGDVMRAGYALVDLGEHRLRDLSRPEHVFQLNAPGLPAEFPPLRSVDARPGNLPRQVTTFVGRETELALLTRALGERALVTLTGVGGVGKTRLALQAAGEMAGAFGDGEWLCELAPVTDSDAVWDTLAASLGVRPSPGRSMSETLLEYLALKRLLLVLDNCEHLLLAAARVVDTIAQRCPHVVVLATSREGLGIAGEQMVAVPSLDLPAADASLDALSRTDAVRLFVDRARDAKSGFTLTEENSTAVAQLCRRLDGIPLALELAAARVRSLTPDDLVERLDQRFKLLTRGSRAALERHQTLRNTIDWSYDLLDAAEHEALTPADAISQRPKGLSPVARSTCSTSPTCSDNSPTSRSLPSTTSDAARGTGCWRRFASTRRSDSKPRVKHRRCDAVMPTTSLVWRRQRVRTCGAPISSSGPGTSRPRSTTSEQLSTGRSSTETPTVRCDWSRRSRSTASRSGTPRSTGPTPRPRCPDRPRTRCSRPSPRGRRGAQRSTEISNAPARSRSR
jgi:class 3 adenylate cyclase